MHVSLYRSHSACHEHISRLSVAHREIAKWPGNWGAEAWAGMPIALLGGGREGTQGGLLSLEKQGLTNWLPGRPGNQYLEASCQVGNLEDFSHFP